MAIQPTETIIAIAADDVNLPATGQPNKTEPNIAIKTTGYDKDQVVTAENLNYIFNNFSEWLTYLKLSEDEFLPRINSLENRNLTAGNGLTGGGNLLLDRTFTLGTPSTLDGNSTNNVTTESHTHALSIASQVESQTGTDDVKLMTPLKVHQAVPYTFSPSSVGGSTQSTTLPNGLIMKWGTELQSGAFTVNFPVAFPNACFTVSLTVKNGGAEPNVTFASLLSKSASSFDTYVDAEVPVVGLEWFAIGY